MILIEGAGEPPSTTLIMWPVFDVWKLKLQISYKTYSNMTKIEWNGSILGKLYLMHKVWCVIHHNHHHNRHQNNLTLGLKCSNTDLQGLERVQACHHPLISTPPCLTLTSTEQGWSRETELLTFFNRKEREGSLNTLCCKHVIYWASFVPPCLPTLYQCQYLNIWAALLVIHNFFWTSVINSVVLIIVRLQLYADCIQLDIM